MWLLILIIEFALLAAIILVWVGANCFHLHILAHSFLQEVMNALLTVLAPLICLYIEVMLFIPIIYIKKNRHLVSSYSIVFFRVISNKEPCFYSCVCSLHSIYIECREEKKKKKKAWMLVVTADSQGCQCCRLTAPEFLWRCVCLKKHWKHSAAVKNHFKRGISDYSKIGLKENTSFLWWILVEVHPKKTEEAICMKMSRAMFQELQYQQQGDVVKYYPLNIIAMGRITRHSSQKPSWN